MSHSGRKAADGILIVCLASGATVQAAAERAGVSASTVQRRLREESFRTAVARARTDCTRQAAGALAAAATAAARKLRKLLRAKSESVQLSAATRILELNASLDAVLGMEDRIRSLEHQYEIEKSDRRAGEASRRGRAQ